MKDLIPTRYRKYAYAGFVLLGVVISAIAVGFGALDSTHPDWLVVALAVYAFLSTASPVIALFNLTPEQTETYQPRHVTESVQGVHVVGEQGPEIMPFH